MPDRSTIRDVAERAGVSIGTISNFLNATKPISDPVRERIEAAIEELKFIPNSAVRVMHGHRTSAIALMVPDSQNPFFAEVAKGVEEVAVQSGLVVVMCNTNGDEARENQYARTLSEMRVTGAIVTPLSAREKNLRQLDISGAAIVVLGTGEGRPLYPTVDVDDVTGGRLAGLHLIERGHRIIAFFGGPGADPQIHARYEGLTQVIREAGLDPSSVERVDSAGSGYADRAKAARRILSLQPAPTAVFCANDLLALVLESEALAAGIDVPNDLSIVGYDDIEAAAMARVPLTTIRQPQSELGVAAARTLLASARGENPKHQRFTPELIQRNSTAPITNS